MSAADRYETGYAELARLRTENQRLITALGEAAETMLSLRAVAKDPVAASMAWNGAEAARFAASPVEGGELACDCGKWIAYSRRKAGATKCRPCTDVTGAPR